LHAYRNARSAAYYLKDKLKQNARTKAWNAAHPEKKRASSTLNNAIRAGKIKRGSCEVCGKLNAHGHHEDYTKPLVVRWLCSLHHRIEHRKHK
jgi:hypothetical protein